jgi:hypothetical protein
MAGAGVITTTITTPTSRAASLFIGGRDFSSSLFLETLKIRDVVGNTRATLETTLRGAVVDLPELYDQARVRFVDHTAGDEPFTGFLRSKHPITGLDPKIEVLAEDRAALLDDIWVDVELRRPETMQQRIGYFWGQYAGSQFSGDLSFVQSIGDTLPLQRYDTVTLRQAIEMIVVQASSTAQFHVDNMGRPHVFTSETNDAPYDVVHATPGGGEVAPTDLDINFDGGAYFNRVLVRGATPEATLFVQDDAAIASAAGLVRTGMLQASEVTTAAMATAVGQQYLASQKAAVARGTFSVESTYDGWRAGQNLTVNDPDIFSSPQPFQIRSVERRVSGRGSNQLHSTYSIEFGGRAIGLEGEGQAPLIAGRSGSVYLLDQLGNAIVSTAASTSTGAFGAVARRYIMSGVYNGDFYAPPPGPDARIDDTTNPLPYWSFVQSSGTSVTATAVLDSGAGSGRTLQFDMASGAAGDEGYIEQLVPVNAARGQNWVYVPRVTFQADTAVNDMEMFLTSQFLKVDGVTTTGTGGSSSSTTTLVGAGNVFDIGNPPNSGAMPSDAFWLRIRCGFRRGSEANGSSGRMFITEVRVVAGPDGLRFPDFSDPTTWTYGRILQDDGVMELTPHAAASGLNTTIGLGMANGVFIQDVRVRHTPQGAIAIRTSTQTITTGTWTAIDFTGTDILDPFAFHNPGSNPSRFTIPTGWSGAYLCVGQIGMGSTTAMCQGSWTVNGAAETGPEIATSRVTGTSEPPRFQVIRVLELNAGDYVELSVQHTVGVNHTLEANCWAAVYYLGELA